MEKYMEENQDNPDREDEIRVNNKDISKSKWTGRGFVPLEQIEDKGEVMEEESDTAEDSEGDRFSLSEELEKEKKIKELKKEVFSFHQGEGVASVSTEESENDTLGRESAYRGYGKPQKEDEFADMEKETLLRVSKRKTNGPITSMSADQVTRQSRDHVSTRKDARGQKGKGNTGEEHDNLKTIPDSKKQRSFRQKIRDFFKMQNNLETSKHKKEEKHDKIHNDHFFVEDLDGVLLDDKPMDKRFLDQEDRAA